MPIITLDKCNICHKDNTKDLIQCAICKLKSHPACLNLSRHDITQLKATDRNTIFHCDPCTNNKNDNNVMISIVTQLTKRIEEMATQISNLTKNLSTMTTAGLSPEMTEDIISEATERQKRASNIIIHNLEEGDENGTLQSKEMDKTATIKLLNNHAGINLNNIQVFRLGKPIPNKIRPLKVLLNNTNDAITILKNYKNNLPQGSNLQITSDKTLKQREFMKKLQQELQQRMSTGETNIKIKYLNGTPKIVISPKND